MSESRIQPSRCSTRYFAVAVALFVAIIALVALYRSTGGDNWTERTNWLTDKHVQMAAQRGRFMGRY
ncbi:MAG: hypothetical protein J4F39_12975 [Candidatus Latescibacteria bacterium]|nr:hypothetical protein [Candidatus Latescibacterota bacterium]